VCPVLPSDWYFTHMYYKLFMGTKKSRWSIKTIFLHCCSLRYLLTPDGVTLHRIDFFDRVSHHPRSSHKEILPSLSWRVVKVRHPPKYLKNFGRAKKTEVWKLRFFWGYLDFYIKKYLSNLTWTKAMPEKWIF